MRDERWAPGSILGRPFFSVTEEVAEPLRFTYVGPMMGNYGTLQIVREGGDRTLCNLPLQPRWKPHADPTGRVICRGCAFVAAELLKANK